MVVAAMVVDLREVGLHVVNGSVGAWPWISAGKASQLTHPPLSVSELEMDLLLYSQDGDGERWQRWDPWRALSFKNPH